MLTYLLPLMIPVIVLTVILVTRKRGQKRESLYDERLRRDVQGYHDALHDAPRRGRSQRYRGPGQGWR